MSLQGDAPDMYAYADALEADEKTADFISMSVALPGYVVVEPKHGDADSIELGWWDHVACLWRVDGFKDVALESESATADESAKANSNAKARRVSFRTCHLAPMSVVQLKGLYCEYTDWRLSPSGVERCRLSLHTKAAHSKLVEIDIAGGHC